MCLYLQRPAEHSASDAAAAVVEQILLQQQPKLAHLQMMEDSLP
jgi:hypothetical protein